MTGTLAIVLIFGGLIFFHELGHFLAARALGMGVQTFSLGFGPALFARTRGKTRYQISALPLGGYVALVGESASSDIPAPFTSGESFSLRPAWQRLIVIAAGSVFNLILAWLLCWGLALGNGKMVVLPEVGSVLAGSPAAVAGIAPGDRLLSLDGTPLDAWEDIVPLAQKIQGRTVPLIYSRNGTEQATTVTPVRSEVSNLLGEKKTNWVLGITDAGTTRTERLSFPEAAVQGVRDAGNMVLMTWKVLTGLFSGRIGFENVGGPIGIGQVIYQQAGQGLAHLLFVAALISVNLGVLNLLPVPVLDGGHIVFLLIEMVTRRKVPPRIQEKAAMVGLALLLTLMLAATYNDVFRLFGGTGAQ